MSQAYESIASYVHQLVSVCDSSVTCLRNQRVLGKQIQRYHSTQSSRGNAHPRMAVGVCVSKKGVCMA